MVERLDLWTAKPSKLQNGIIQLLLGADPAQSPSSISGRLLPPQASSPRFRIDSLSLLTFSLCSWSQLSAYPCEVFLDSQDFIIQDSNFVPLWFKSAATEAVEIRSWLVLYNPTVPGIVPRTYLSICFDPSNKLNSPMQVHTWRMCRILCWWWHVSFRMHPSYLLCHSLLSS